MILNYDFMDEEKAKSIEENLIERLKNLKESQRKYELFDGFRTDEDYTKEIEITQKNLDNLISEFCEYLI